MNAFLEGFTSIFMSFYNTITSYGFLSGLGEVLAVLILIGFGFFIVITLLFTFIGNPEEDMKNGN